MSELEVDEARRSSNELTVLHLGHSHSRGGAEMALARMLRSPMWNATVARPPVMEDAGAADPFVDVSPDVVLRAVGPMSRAGASKATRLAALQFAWNLVRQAFSLRFSREFRSVDIVHANTTRSGLYGALACILAPRVRLVVHLRDAVTAESIGSLGALVYRYLVLRRADGVVANSHHTLQSALDAAPMMRAKTLVLASASGIKPKLTESVSVTDPPRNIGMVARLDPWKGQELLIRAFYATGLAGKGMRLYFAGAAPFGNEPYARHLRSLTESLGLAPYVEFLGHVDDVDSFIDKMDVCVQSSTRAEPLGQNVLQYLSRGKPTVASDEGGPKEWIQHEVNGVLFESRSQKSLEYMLLRLVHNSGMRLDLARQAVATPGLKTDEEISRDMLKFFNVVAGGAS